MKKLGGGTCADGDEKQKLIVLEQQVPYPSCDGCVRTWLAVVLSVD